MILAPILSQPHEYTMSVHDTMFVIDTRNDFSKYVGHTLNVVHVQPRKFIGVWDGDVQVWHMVSTTHIFKQSSYGVQETPIWREALRHTWGKPNSVRVSSIWSHHRTECLLIAFMSGRLYKMVQHLASCNGHTLKVLHKRDSLTLRCEFFSFSMCVTLRCVFITPGMGALSCHKV